ncbi:MAG: hypothetical protein H7259_03955, partial [Cytophagales bacterium]|nr:hypothetical protein [Cytophaga sp.]
MNPSPHTQLATKAAILADMQLIIDPYIKWNNEQIKFVFTTNAKMSGRIDKPSYFPADKRHFMDYWQHKLIWEKREILCYFADMSDRSV